VKSGRLFLLLLIGLWGPFGFSGHAQKIPIIRFSQDSIRIGQPVQLSVCFHYASEKSILFPDTSHSFAPFELLKKEFYPTKTTGGISRDSVIYILTTFLPDSIQTIQIPVYEFSERDSTSWISEPATLKVIPSFRGSLPDKPVIYQDLSPHPIPTQFNYPYLFIASGVFLILVIGINFFFNRPIQRFLYLFIERRRNSAYLAQFQRLNTQLEKNLSTENFERLINLWKRYIQRVDGKPFTTYTSTEIIKVLPQPELKKSLQEIDRWIYGGVEMKDWRHNLEQIKEVSTQLYNKKRENIRSGKFE